MKDTVYLGTELKVNVHIEPFDGLAMSIYKFSVDAFCSPSRAVHYDKSDLIKADNDNYVVRIDTAKMGIGNLKLRVIALIPDSDFDDDLRTEVVLIDTGITIVKS